ncbi:MAG: 2-dehydro-3-deoxygalactonokinase [Gammaproteobacteria bacterium]|nr:2-dehydro-3-deoxygalactonokinase [Gammaproteobacteria bacterium]
MDQLAWIAVDWGTTSLRIWGLSETQDIVFEQCSAQGMATLNDAQAFEEVLLQHIEEYLLPSQQVDVVCCGMVGAKQGWFDAGYQTLPCNPLAMQSAVTVPMTDTRCRVWILPGLCQTSPADVMRGEETQIAGVLAAHANFDGVVCLPGTHSKWASCKAGLVTEFATYMTGEMFALLSQQSVLRFSVASELWHDEVFVEAVKEAVAQPATISHLLFSVRSADLLGQGATTYGKARLSGLLIGLELAGAGPFWQHKTVHLIGNDALSQCYQLALSSLAIDYQVYDGETCVLRGLQAAYQQLKSDDNA